MVDDYGFVYIGLMVWRDWGLEVRVSVGHSVTGLVRVAMGIGKAVRESKQKQAHNVLIPVVLANFLFTPTHLYIHPHIHHTTPLQFLNLHPPSLTNQPT